MCFHANIMVTPASPCAPACIPQYEGKRDTSDYVKALLDDSVTFTYPNAEEAMSHVEEHVERHGPYDTLMGFSQGAILITLLTAARLARSRAGTAPPPPWRQNVLVCGLPVRANSFYPLFRTPLDFPCTVAQGRNDPMYEWCMRLASQYVDAETFEYDDGHRFPRSREDNAVIAASMRRRLLRAKATAATTTTS